MKRCLNYTGVFFLFSIFFWSTGSAQQIDISSVPAVQYGGNLPVFNATQEQDTLRPGQEHVGPMSIYKSCDGSDIGSDALWKYPSESWGDGAAFIPPMGACKTKEILDEDGKGTGKYKIIRNKIVNLAMCTDLICNEKLEFERIDFGEFCVWRVHKKTWEKFFGGKKFKLVLILKDGRFLQWEIKDPVKRNGMPPYGNLAYKSAPACYKLKNMK
ncbi:MAG: hypothetical protein COT17_01505 [Elusimicrobia bacterium CG08_land_8_20_14_0_20_51_18]|nr:MAG: hypothetical protein COT17_01505 [Elusimicrobia bacterium CG08_land_8_20_14_0_20_51_18]